LEKRKKDTGEKKIDITDIRSKVEAKIDHIMKVEFETKRDGTKRFTGVHSNQALTSHPYGARKELIDKNADTWNEPYRAKVFAKDENGIEYQKTGGGGVSTFFPDSWDRARILDEVEHAVENNRGLLDPLHPRKGYFGFSKDGNIKINFYYNQSTGAINSYFPLIE
jgi:hypothetical protein